LGRGRLPSWSVRLRLTLLYGALFLVMGALLLAITYELVAGSVPGNVSGLVALSIRAPKPRSLVVTKSNGALYLSPHARAAPSPAQAVVGPPDAPVGGPGFAKLQRLANGLRGQARVTIQQQRSDELGALLTRSGIALGIMALVSIGLGWLMAGRALRPVRTMNARARGITEHNLHERLALEGPADELKELGDTFDGLLSRLEGAFESQRRFVANASHELRTPITVQRTLVEVALGDPNATEASLRAACERVIAVGEQQERLIASLLTLARSQRGIETQQRLDLDQVVREVLHCVQAGDVRIEARLEPAPTTGDPALVERLVANLVDNALHYNRPRGWIRASTGLWNGRATLEVSNAGPAVAADEVELLFEPFRRQAGERTLSPGRQPARQGLGLGLSIVRAIADAHGAELTATSGAQGGLRVRVSFPAAAPEVREPADGTEPFAGGVGLMV
jgi:signal transduction histidine kinase